MHLLKDKSWSGPTVLLAPGHRIMASNASEETAEHWRVSSDEPAGGAEPIRPQVIVAHCNEDQVVPFSHSSELCDLNSSFKLVTVDDGAPPHVSSCFSPSSLPLYLFRISLHLPLPLPFLRSPPPPRPRPHSLKTKGSKSLTTRICVALPEKHSMMVLARAGTISDMVRTVAGREGKS